MANVLSMAKKVAVITPLVEGCSIRSISRMTGVAKGTIIRLLESVGTACQEYQNVTLRNIPAKRVQMTKFGAFATPRPRTSRRKSQRSESPVMFGLLLPSKRRRNLLLAGWYAGGTRGVQRTSFRTLQGACRIGCS